MDRGLVVTELMGQGVNGVTGDYSRGAAGFWVENGAIAYPVHEITIAGNLKRHVSADRRRRQRRRCARRHPHRIGAARADDDRRRVESAEARPHECCVEASDSFATKSLTVLPFKLFAIASSAARAAATAGAISLIVPACGPAVSCRTASSTSFELDRLRIARRHPSLVFAPAAAAWRAPAQSRSG